MSSGHGKSSNAKLAIAALGVVYGDIGTSPLYAAKECFTSPHGVAPTPENVFGILSLIFWSLTFVVAVKYLGFIMRADNDGEGGILALLALVAREPPAAGLRVAAKTTSFLVLLGLFGAALLYGDGMITPAISVLSAMEGLSVATSAFDPIVIPATCGILIALFLVQKRGTAKVGAIFGPATMVWFVVIAALGVPWIVREPRILLAVSPHHAIRFFGQHGVHGFLVLASVVLCITGGEALYADMGHFGRGPIRLAWSTVVFPALLLNYFGQGALLLRRGTAVAHPFYELVPAQWVVYPLVAIAAVATVVASQALISGAFSLTQQAVQLGYFPRVSIVHTSHEHEGQIYVPEVNAILLVACVALVLVFRKSDNLAAAYGIAVTGTMAITSVLFYVVARERWNWSYAKAGTIVGAFLVFDLAFFVSNATKIASGGWFPIAVAAGVFAVMTTWKRGRRWLERRKMEATLPLDLFKDDFARSELPRVDGTGVFLTPNPEGIPSVLLQHMKHNRVIHKRVILVCVATTRGPTVREEDRVHVESLGKGLYSVVAKFGFTETPSIPAILRACAGQGLEVDPTMVSYYLGRETLVSTGRSGMSRWRRALFGFLARNARPATAFFQIPPERVLEMGGQMEM